MRGFGMLGRRTAGRILLAWGAVASWQVSTWALWGRRTLVEQIPAMAGLDLSLKRASHERSMAWYRANGLGSSEFHPRPAVIPRRCGQLLGSTVIERLRVVYQASGSSVFVEPDVPPELRYRTVAAGYEECDDCSIFLPAFRFNTPLLANVVISYSLAPDAATFFEHRLVWCLGFWVTVSTRLGGAT